MTLAPPLYVTGTDTGVGKTIATAALAAALTAAGGSVAVFKPTQAGLEDGAGDIDVVTRLSGLSAVSEGIRLAYPMAPVAAAAREGVALPSVARQRERITALADSHDHVLVEGAGGLLVALDGDGHTLADIAGPGAQAVVVCRAALGTLNHTALTLEALRARGLICAGLVIGAWPAEPDAIDLSNRLELARMAPLLGQIPAGAGALNPATFRAAAPGWFAGVRRAYG